MGDEETALPCQITNWKAEGRSWDAVVFLACSFELMDGKEMCDLKTQPDRCLLFFFLLVLAHLVFLHHVPQFFFCVH